VGTPGARLMFQAWTWFATGHGLKDAPTCHLFPQAGHIAVLVAGVDFHHVAVNPSRFQAVDAPAGAHGTHRTPPANTSQVLLGLVVRPDWTNS